MQLGVTYDIKHSGQFLYKLSNEKDKKSFEITKIALPSQISNILEESSQNKEKSDLTPLVFSGRLNQRELAPISSYLQDR